MNHSKLLGWLVLLFFPIFKITNALDNGLSLTPALGWNSWNQFACDVSEDLILTTAKAIVETGLRDVGYKYIILDDCWSLKQRNETGHLVADPERFPHGMKYVADKVHELGLKWGMYGSAGTMTCAQYPGQLFNEEIDAQTFASWDVDYFKYDNCYNLGLEGNQRVSFERYNNMSVALNNTGRPIVYAICNWGVDGPWHFAQTIANSWRISGDIEDYYDKDDPRCPCEAESSQLDCKFAGNHCSAMKILDYVAPYSHRGRPGRWNDLDMLEVGRGGMSYHEYITHFSMWAMVKSPLILGNDVRDMSAETYSIIANPAVIAINQDPLGEPAERRYKKKVPGGGDIQLWVAELANDSYAVAIVNTTPNDRVISTSFSEIFDLNTTARALSWEVRDLWEGNTAILPEKGSVALDPIENVGDDIDAEIALGKVIGRTSNSLRFEVKSHGTRLLRLRNGLPLAENDLTLQQLNDSPSWYERLLGFLF